MKKEKQMKKLTNIFLASILFLAALNILTQDKPGGKLSGLVFGDYFYKVQGDSSGNSGEYAPYGKDYQAFDIRRIMLIYEHSISDKFTAGFSFEGGNKFLLNGRFSVIVKTAYLEWKNVFENQNLYIGYFPTPAFVWGISEKMWNYRSVEKTISDTRGLTTAVDLGIGLRGSFDKKLNYGYSLMIGNGGGLKPENNKFKKYYASLYAKPVEGLNVEVYTEFEPNADDKNKVSIKGVLAYQMPSFTIGVEAVQQTQKKTGVNNSDIKPLGISSYVWGTLVKDKKTKAPKLNAFARFDYYDPNTALDSVGFRENFITAGIDYMPVPSVHIMPNVWINTYTDKSTAKIKKDADIAARLTFFYIYK
jgi:hypothetical protein